MSAFNSNWFANLATPNRSAPVFQPPSQPHIRGGNRPRSFISSPGMLGSPGGASHLGTIREWDNTQTLVNGRPNALGQFTNTMFAEIGQKQAAADRQRDRMMQAGQGIVQEADAGAAAVMGTAERTAQPLGALADQFTAQMDPNAPGSMIGRSNRFADEAVAESRRARDEFQANTLEDESNFATSMSRRFQDEMTQLQSEFGPLAVNSEQFESIKRERLRGFGAELNQGLNQIRSTFRQNVAGLTNQLSQTMLQAGNMAQSGAQVQQNWGQLAMQSRQAWGNVLNSAQAAAVQMRLSGRDRMADIIQQNPESIFSYTEGLLAAMNVRDAGWDKRSAFSVGRSS